MIPGAIAAALLATVIPQPVSMPTHDPYRQSMTQTAPPIVNSKHDWSATGAGLMRPVGTAPRTRSDRGRELIGVVGDDGNLYWIEVERTRTIRLPASSEAGRSNSDWM